MEGGKTSGFNRTTATPRCCRCSAVLTQLAVPDVQSNAQARSLAQGFENRHRTTIYHRFPLRSDILVVRLTKGGGCARYSVALSSEVDGLLPGRTPNSMVFVQTVTAMEEGRAVRDTQGTLMDTIW